MGSEYINLFTDIDFINRSTSKEVNQMIENNELVKPIDSIPTSPKLPDYHITSSQLDISNLTVPEIKQKYPALDIRSGLTHIFFDRYQYGNVLLHKTARIGFTTSSALASIDRHEMCIIVEPTNRIARETIIQDVGKFRPNAKLIQIKANICCLKNQEMCNEHTDLKELQFLPLAGKCDDCELYDECPITEPLREPDIDVLVITADKLAAIMLGHEKDNDDGTPTIAKQFYKVINRARNIVFDEAHWMQSHMPVSYNHIRLDVASNVITTFNVARKYEKLVEQGLDQYNSIIYIIKKFTELINHNHIINISNKVLDKTKSPDYYKQHINEPVKNPLYNRSSFAEMRANLVQLCAQAIKLIKSNEHRTKYHYTMNDINIWFTMAEIVSNEYVQINGIRSYNRVNIGISGSAKIKLAMIKEFIHNMQIMLDKRIILTSATLGTWNYRNMFIKGTAVFGTMFGINGDPIATNDKMLVLVDTKRLSNNTGNYSVSARIKEIANQVIRAIEELEQDCFIVAANKEQAYLLSNMLKKLNYDYPVNYYGSDKTIGVSQNARVCIAVNIAYIPTNTFDLVTSYKHTSKIRMYDHIHSVTCQTLYRVKDPNGKDPSVVIMIGATEEQANAIFTWGPERKIELNENTIGKKHDIDVSCLKYVSKPQIIKCKDFSTTLVVAKQHLQISKSGSPSSKGFKNDVGSQQSKGGLHWNLPILNNNFITFNIGRFQCKQVSYEQLLNLISTSKAAGASDLSESKILRHLNGKSIQKTRIIGDDGIVNWIQLNGIKLKTDAIIVHKRLLLPHLVEYNNKSHTYNIWIFIEPIELAKAKKFGEKILQDIRNGGIKLDCEVFPKYTNKRSVGYKDEIKLPLNPDSALFVNSGLNANLFIGNKDMVAAIERRMEKNYSFEIGIINIEQYVEIMMLREEVIAAAHKNDPKVHELVEEYSKVLQNFN
jgi:hypothetical protein